MMRSVDSKLSIKLHDLTIPMHRASDKHILCYLNVFKGKFSQYLNVILIQWLNMKSAFEEVLGPFLSTQI